MYDIANHKVLEENGYSQGKVNAEDHKFQSLQALHPADSPTIGFSL